MKTARDVVITGMGIISPIGIGREPFWDALGAGRSGVRALDCFAGSDLPAPLGAEIPNFEPQQFIRPRKALKVMSRDIQLAFAAAEQACADAQLEAHPIPPERLGVIFGADLIPAELGDIEAAYRGCIEEGRFNFSRWGVRAMSDIFPLWMLKYLPNMPACHIGIARDARGPNNSLVLGDVSGLAALAEAATVIARGQADAMIAGGASAPLTPLVWLRHRSRQVSQRVDQPSAASRPFDAQRDGLVYGEGAAAYVLESRQQAEARGAKILAQIRSHASRFEPRRQGQPLQGTAIRAAIEAALRGANLRPEEIGHVNAHGSSTTDEDRLEAQAIRATLGDVPVTAPKSYFGCLGAASGAVELAVSLLALERGSVPPTLNYEHPDPECPIRVIHGGPHPLGSPRALVHNQSPVGQSVALVLSRDL